MFWAMRRRRRVVRAGMVRRHLLPHLPGDLDGRTSVLDMVFNGGRYGMWVGNQQFTVRNVTVNNANTAVYQSWNWGQCRDYVLGCILISVG